MSKLLKRPMFRKGGAVEEGIMKLATGGRAMYADGPGPALDPNDPLVKEAQRRESLLRQFAGSPGDAKQDLYDVLISGGINLAGGVGAGDGTIASIARSFKEPTEKFLAKRPGEEAFQRQIKMAAAQGAISAEDAARILEKELAGKKEIAGIASGAKTGPEVLKLARAEEYRKTGSDYETANNLAKYDIDIKPELNKRVGATQVGGTIQIDITNPKQKKDFINKNKDKKDKYFYDAKLDAVYKLITDPSTGELNFSPVAIESITPAPKLDGKDKKDAPDLKKQKKDINKRFTYLSKNQRQNLDQTLQKLDQKLENIRDTKYPELGG